MKVKKAATRANDQLAPIFKAFRDCAVYAEDAEKQTEFGHLKAKHRKAGLWARKLSDSDNPFARKAFKALVRQDKNLLEDQRPILAVLHPASIDPRHTSERYEVVSKLVKDLRSVTTYLQREEAATLVNANVLDLLYTVQSSRVEQGNKPRPTPVLRSEKERFYLSMRDFLTMYASWIEEFKIPESVVSFESGKTVLRENLVANAVREKAHRNKSKEVGDFCLYLTAVFKRQYGQYLPAVVANLANAIFEPVPEISTDNVKAMTPGLEKRPTSKSRQPQSRGVK